MVKKDRISLDFYNLNHPQSLIKSQRSFTNDDVANANEFLPRSCLNLLLERVKRSLRLASVERRVR